MTADELLGRGEQCGRLRAVLAGTRQGMSAVLVLRGGPGTGKSALLDYIRSVADDAFDVLRFDAVETEAELGFAALHQLLLPYLARLPELPAPQQESLSRVFGLQARTSPPDRLLVGLAALGLLAARGGDRPLLCLVDDAHWLDQESAQALSFVARRLFADSIAMVFATREVPERVDALAGLPSMEVAALQAHDAALLLQAVVPGALDPEVCTRIVACTGGNPLALIEAARELSAEQLCGLAPLPEPVPLGQRLEPSYLRDVLALPARTRTLLLVAAADPTGDPNVLWRAGRELRFDEEAAADAEGRELLTIRDRVAFRHPLIRSAVYYGAPLAQRVRVHAALARVAGDLGAADLRAWHLAAAATGPDEPVAAELERAADRTRDRGGWAAGSTLLARSAALTGDPALRARRLLAAAEASTVAGAPARAQTLLDEASACRQDRHGNGLGLRVQARIHRLMGDPAAATSTLLAAAGALGPVDVRLARDILVEALVQAQISGSLAPRGATRMDVAQTIRSIPLPPQAQPTTGDAVLEADTAVHLEGLRAAAPGLRRAINAVRGEPTGAPELFQWLAAACSHATVLGDDVALHELAWRLEAEARRCSAVIPMALALSHTALSELIAGRLVESERLFDQRSALEEARGSELHLGALLVAAWRGQAERVCALAQAVAEDAARTGQGYQLVFCDYACSVLELSLGHYDQAYASLAEKIGDTSQLKFALVDQVEAACRSGNTKQARMLVDQLHELAGVAPVSGTLGDLARASALLDPDGHNTEALYLQAITHHKNTRGPARRARSHQLFGEWLRRERRTKEARHHLRIAYALFDAMGAGGYAERTARELSAAGDPVQPRSETEHESVLTAQEARVAHLAGSGATNAEIAAQLFLSTHTVDFHLRKVFRKLGIRSRRELAAHPDQGR